MLTQAELALVDAATDLITRRHGNENHTVAAAALDSAGEIHSGLNAYHFSGGPCAELVVIGHAASVSDHLPLTTMVAVGGTRTVIPPCGRCRQVMFDYYPDIRVIVRKPIGLEAVPVTELLPYAFDVCRITERQRVYFAPAYLDAVRAGTKTTTVRYHDPVRVGPATLVFEQEDGELVVDADVTSVAERRLRDLTDADALRDGFADRDELLAALRAHYPGIGADAVVQIVTFQVV